MRIALLSDIHGNRIALDACLSRLAARGADEVYFLGDAIGYMPAGAEVVASLRLNGFRCQQGNHEAMMFSPATCEPAMQDVYRIRAARRDLSESDLEFVRSWPERRTVVLAGRRVLLVHGSPASALRGYVYPDDDLSVCDDGRHDVVVMGHTHYPFVKQRNGKLFVNVGSVGLPRDREGLGSFAFYDTLGRTAWIERVPFDTDEVISAYGKDMHDSIRNRLVGRTVGRTYERRSAC